jgi:hypothetical protein
MRGILTSAATGLQVVAMTPASSTDRAGDSGMSS